MAIAGRVAIVPKGDWSADATYKRLDAVTYNNTLYFAKKEVPVGTATSNTEYWSKSIVGGVGAIATKEDAGIVKPADGLSIAEDGTLKVSIDGTTLTMDQVNNVIKLADTLKEKINGAFPAANLINNLTTTEAGFGLDARQGKALDDKITEINGSLYNKIWNIAASSDAWTTVFSYTAETDCLVSLYAETYYSNTRPCGLKALTNCKLYSMNDTSESTVSKVESDDYNEINLSCIAFVRKGSVLMIKEKLISAGRFSGGVVYSVRNL